MHIAFQKNAWDESAVTHAYTYRFPYTNRFIQHEDAIENGANPEMADGFDYLSIMSREAFPTGTRITTRCSFSGNAAPLLIFSDALDLCEDGVYRYGNYFEVVARRGRQGHMAQAARRGIPRRRERGPHAVHGGKGKLPRHYAGSNARLAPGGGSLPRLPSRDHGLRGSLSLLRHGDRIDRAPLFSTAG